MQVRLFGELEASDGGVPVPVRGAKQRALRRTLGSAAIPSTEGPAYRSLTDQPDVTALAGRLTLAAGSAAS